MTDQYPGGSGMLAPETLQAIRDTNAFPLVGLETIIVEPACHVDQLQVDDFLAFLGELVSGIPIKRPAGIQGIADVCSTDLSWQRESLLLYPFYVEILRITPAPHDLGGEPPFFYQAKPGEWHLWQEVLMPTSANFFRSHASVWKRYIENALEAGTAAGGLSLNLLTVPAASLSDGSLELRPLVLHALSPDGASTDRGDCAAQAAIANAFWQTFWATGALRADRGSVFPVAFLPVDRSNHHEFDEPFHERYVSLRRRLFGRTSILAYVLEILTQSHGLYFDRDQCRFVIDAEFVIPSDKVLASDVLLALGEMNRTAFVDAYIGANRLLMAKWIEYESRGLQAQPWPFGTSGDNGSNGALKIKSRAHGGPDVLKTVRAQSGARLARIQRVIPYDGCAYLYEAVSQSDKLRASGKIQDFDGEVLAATNSTFFLNFPEEYAALHSAMNDPVSVLVENGRTVQLKTMRRSAFVLTDDLRAMISTRLGNRLENEMLLFEGESTSMNAFEKSNRSFAENTAGPLFFGAVIVGNSIVETFEDISTEVPLNGWVIGDSEAFGGRVVPEAAVSVQLREPGKLRETQIRHAFGVGPILVENGNIVPLGNSPEEFQGIKSAQSPAFEETSALSRTELPAALKNCEARGVPPLRFPYDWNKTRAPRSAIGIRANGDVVVAVVDGRAKLSHSVGATLAELAEIMKGVACVDAMNMDGGGSSVMFVNDNRADSMRLSETVRPGVVNLPSDMGGVERLLPVPLAIMRRKRAGGSSK